MLLFTNIFLLTVLVVEGNFNIITEQKYNLPENKVAKLLQAPTNFQINNIGIWKINQKSNLSDEVIASVVLRKTPFTLFVLDHELFLGAFLYDLLLVFLDSDGLVRVL